MSITIRKILHFFNKLRDIKKTFEKVTHFTPLHPTMTFFGKKSLLSLAHHFMKGGALIRGGKRYNRPLKRHYGQRFPMPH